MSAVVEYLANKATAEQIAEHLSRCEDDFVPPLRGRVDIKDYAQKIESRAIRFEAWIDEVLIGLVAAYCNDERQRIAYITSVSVLKDWTGKGIAAGLMHRCIEHAKSLGMRQIGLEVAGKNSPAIKLYRRFGFVAESENSPFVSMNLNLQSVEDHEQQA